MYKPNLQLPLASSYNERGIAGFTNTVTNRIDQQKINCLYEITKNSITGGGKLDLIKRPGVTIESHTYGVSAQSAYLISTAFAGQLSDTPIIFAKNGNDITTSNTASTSTVFSSASAYTPQFVDKTIISGAENIILQSSIAGAAPKVFFNNSFPVSTEITDVDFPSPQGKMEYMDGFAFALNASTNRIHNSDLNSLANWTATSFISKQIDQDYPVGLAKLNNQILAFGEQSVEPFYNAGNATGSPLLPIKQLHQKIGMFRFTAAGSTHYYATLENRIYFIGRLFGGTNSVGLITYNGSIYEKVSTSYIDKILGEATLYAVNSFSFQGKSAISIQLTAPTAATQRWLMYFPEWKDWFEWNSTVIQPTNAGQFFLGVTPNQQKIYSFPSTDNWQDNGTSFTSSTQFKLPQDGHQRKRMAEFGVLADTARSTNMLSVEFSDDDYVSFINIGAIDLARDIKTLNRGGSYRQRAVRLSSTNALETRLSAFIARIE